MPLVDTVDELFWLSFFLTYGLRSLAYGLRILASDDA